MFDGAPSSALEPYAPSSAPELEPSEAARETDADFQASQLDAPPAPPVPPPQRSVFLLCEPHEDGLEAHVFSWLPTILEELGAELLRRLPVVSQSGLSCTCCPLHAVLRRNLAREHRSALDALYRRLGTPRMRVPALAELNWTARGCASSQHHMLALDLCQTDLPCLARLRLAYNHLGATESGCAVVAAIPFEWSARALARLVVSLGHVFSYRLCKAVPTPPAEVTRGPLQTRGPPCGDTWHRVDTWRSLR